MRLIHVKTQEQYNSWMRKLEDEGYVWNGGDAPINIDEINEPDASFVIELEIDDATLSYGYRGYYTRNHPDTEIEDDKENDQGLNGAVAKKAKPTVSQDNKETLSKYIDNLELPDNFDVKSREVFVNNELYEVWITIKIKE